MVCILRVCGHGSYGKRLEERRTESIVCHLCVVSGNFGDEMNVIIAISWCCPSSICTVCLCSRGHGMWMFIFWTLFISVLSLSPRGLNVYDTWYSSKTIDQDEARTSCRLSAGRTKKSLLSQKSFGLSKRIKCTNSSAPRVNSKNGSDRVFSLIFELYCRSCVLTHFLRTLLCFLVTLRVSCIWTIFITRNLNC